MPLSIFGLRVWTQPSHLNPQSLKELVLLLLTKDNGTTYLISSKRNKRSLSLTSMSGKSQRDITSGKSHSNVTSIKSIRCHVCKEAMDFRVSVAGTHNFCPHMGRAYLNVKISSPQGALIRENWWKFLVHRVKGTRSASLELRFLLARKMHLIAWFPGISNTKPPILWGPKEADSYHALIPPLICPVGHQRMEQPLLLTLLGDTSIQYSGNNYSRWTGSREKVCCIV